MTPIEQAHNWLSKQEPAIAGAGGHDQTFHIAAALVEGFNLSIADARPLMLEYSARCQPPWTEREIDHKLESAYAKRSPGDCGKMLRKGVRWKLGNAPRSDYGLTSRPTPTPQPAPKAAKYDVPDSTELPDPMPDGARAFLRAVFAEGEGIQIQIARTGDDGRELPKDGGVTLSREEWLRKLDDHKGNPNGFLRTGDKNGIFVRINPMKPGGNKDADVTDLRHALIEFDEISQVEQWGIICASRIPCSAVISSGNKSIHAWVRVDAKDRQEYDERVKLLYEHFSDYKPDEKNKNPSRFSRLPFCERGTKRQELLALQSGCSSFSEWLIESAADGLGKTITPKDLKAFKTADDGNNLLGNRWLCRGMAALLVAASGLGKSTLGLQMACCWGSGQPAFGIVPTRPLKSLIIQAENDEGDLAEMYQGILSGMGIIPELEQVEADQMLDANIIFQRDNSHTGQAFTDNVRRLLDRHKPDILWLDPILSFVGADLSRMEVIGQFFRNWLNPILDASGVACICIHHTGKPPGDKQARQHWQMSDYAYAGLGSSDLTNWARAVMVLLDRGNGLFELKLAKRGKKAGVPLSIWLKHAEKSIYWEPGEEPEQHEHKERKGGKPSKQDQIIGMNMHDFCAACTADGEGKNAIAKRLEQWLAGKGVDASPKTCQRVIEKLVETKKLTKTKDSTYTKGDNA